jgi:uncharacterized protein with FMN-binding domain
MKKRRVVFLTILMLVIGAVIAAAGLMSYAKKNLEQLAHTTISEVDLAGLENGVYTGSYKAFPVTAEVRVTINNHRITEIKLVEHKNGQGAPAEVIPDRVVEEQTLGVEEVSGATYSSKVILKAIENALISAAK